MKKRLIIKGTPEWDAILNILKSTETRIEELDGYKPEDQSILISDYSVQITDQE